MQAICSAQWGASHVQGLQLYELQQHGWGPSNILSLQAEDAAMGELA